MKLKEKKKEIDFILNSFFIGIGMDKPSNYQNILDFVFDDVNETADDKNWSDGDVVIGFRRWIENVE